MSSAPTVDHPKCSCARPTVFLLSPCQLTPSPPSLSLQNVCLQIVFLLNACHLNAFLLLACLLSLFRLTACLPTVSCLVDSEKGPDSNCALPSDAHSGRVTVCRSIDSCRWHRSLNSASWACHSPRLDHRRLHPCPDRPEQHSEDLKPGDDALMYAC